MKGRDKRKKVAWKRKQKTDKKHIKQVEDWLKQQALNGGSLPSPQNTNAV